MYCLKKLLVIAFFIELIFSGPIEDLNSNPHSTWTAKEYSPEVVESIRSKLIRPWTLDSDKSQKETKGDDSVPDSFDARVQWGSLIQPVEDSDYCEVSVSRVVVETASDRFSIAANKTTTFSLQDMIFCTGGGCDGGYVDKSWQYVQSTGLALASCLPWNPQKADCPKVCQNGSAIDRTKAKSVYPLSYAQMQTDLLTNGPFQAAFSVYEDFMSYSSGVYQHTWGVLEGGHSVLIIGWGVSNELPYWIVQNSWGPDWGAEGYFWILRGTDECGIEDDCYAATFVGN